MAKDNPRARRLGEQIQRELTDLLRRDVKDERIGNVTITAVRVTGDLRTARVYYLIFGKEGPDSNVQRGLESAAGFLRNALSKSLMIRYTPTLSFELDTSIEHGIRLTQLIDSVNKPPGGLQRRGPSRRRPQARLRRTMMTVMSSTKATIFRHTHGGDSNGEGG